MGLGISSTDFDQIVSDWGRGVTVNVSTRTEHNVTGDENFAYGSGTSRTVVFLKREIRYQFDKDGIIERGDAYIMADTSFAVKKDDKVTYGGETFYVKQVIRRYADGDTTMFDFCVLYRV